MSVPQHGKAAAKFAAASSSRSAVPPQMQKWTPVCEKPPPDREKSVIIEGYGSHIMRRLLVDADGWREALDRDAGSPYESWTVSRDDSPEQRHRFVKACERTPAQLHWVSCNLARQLMREASLDKWQVINHFARSGVMGSKSGLLWNLRRMCQQEGSDLFEFFPRAYDLREPRELVRFILDFAVTCAEGVVQTPLTGVAQIMEAKAATDLLERLAQVLEIKVANALVTAGDLPPGEEPSAFSKEEWALLQGNLRTRPGASAGTPEKQTEQEVSTLAALALETRWWRDHLKNQSHRQFWLNGSRSIWILKDPNASCGRGIDVCSNLLDALSVAQAAEWNVVAQKYLERPLLVGQPKRKCDFRLWVTVSSWNPAAIWVWPEPYLRLASKAYNMDASTVSDHFVHLTNRAVQKTLDKEEAVSPVSAPEPRAEDEDHIWLLPAFFAWADGQGLKFKEQSARERWQSCTWPRMLAAVRAAVLASQVDVGKHPPGCFELFGFDFILDEDMWPWLLEANSSPDLCEDAGPSLRRMTEGALNEMLRLVLGLRTGSVQLPDKTAGSAECDETVPGSGRWRLCLLESMVLPEQWLNLQQVLKSSPKTTSVTSGAEAKRKFFLGAPWTVSPHVTVLNTLLGKERASEFLRHLAAKQGLLPGDDDESDSLFPVPIRGVVRQKLAGRDSMSPARSAIRPASLPQVEYAASSRRRTFQSGRSSSSSRVRLVAGARPLVGNLKDGASAFVDLAAASRDMVPRTSQRLSSTPAWRRPV
eukprot:TRINITY_DN29250_c0_g1_i2.p1 TRINITY_DN29250_c0_g1~~TRINITY_DN29250_c0_g1_i2.p1  ORF type:complete len:762 (-),score=158.68 TRINITY_DN29250_c0_g1_i2:492-2777(-)